MRVGGSPGPWLGADCWPSGSGCPEPPCSSRPGAVSTPSPTSPLPRAAGHSGQQQESLKATAGGRPGWVGPRPSRWGDWETAGTSAPPSQPCNPPRTFPGKRLPAAHPQQSPWGDPLQPIPRPGQLVLPLGSPWLGRKARGGGAGAGRPGLFQEQNGWASLLRETPQARPSRGAGGDLRRWGGNAADAQTSKPARALPSARAWGNGQVAGWMAWVPTDGLSLL